MCGSDLLKIMGVVLLVLLMGLIQVSFTVLEIKDVVPNLVLITVFIVGFLEIRSKSHLGWRSFSAVIAGGVLLDIYSTLPLGTEALMMLGVVLATEAVLQFLDKINFVVFLGLFVPLLVVYQIVFNFLSFGSFGLSWFALVYNLSLAILLYIICFLGKIFEKK